MVHRGVSPNAKNEYCISRGKYFDGDGNDKVDVNRMFPFMSIFIV